MRIKHVGLKGVYKLIISFFLSLHHEAGFGFLRKFHSLSGGRVRERVHLHMYACMGHVCMRVCVLTHICTFSFTYTVNCIWFCFIQIKFPKLLLLSSTTHSKIMNISCGNQNKINRNSAAQQW